VLLENRIGPFHFAKQNVVAPEIGEVDEYTASVSLGEQATVANDVVQDEPPVAGKVDIDDFDIRVQPTHIILPCKFAANTSVSALVVDCVDLDSLGIRRIVVEVEHAHVSDQARAQKLADEALVPVIGTTANPLPRDC
jgi:hypothetical protein